MFRLLIVCFMLILTVPAYAQIPDGVVKEYFPSGNLSYSQTMRHGKINGPVKAYYENGKLKGSVTYVDNLEEGTLKSYYENGKVKEVALYVKGQMINLKTYDEQGRLTDNRNSNFPVGCGRIK